MMTNTFVMKLYKRDNEDSAWQPTAVIANESYTEKDWQEKVVDAKDFFVELGGIETRPDERTIEYIDATKKGKIIYQLQNTEERHKSIDQALFGALLAYTPDAIRAIMKDDNSDGRFNWRNNAEFLNQTSSKELERAIKLRFQ